MKINQNLPEVMMMISTNTPTNEVTPLLSRLRKGWRAQQGFAHGLCQPPLLHPYSRHLAKNVSTLAILQTCVFSGSL